MHFKWLAIFALVLPIPAAAQIGARLPPVPPPAKPLPYVPQTDEDGMALLGFGYNCKASVGEGEFALKGGIGIGPDGDIGMISVNSEIVAANPAQVLADGERSKEPWSYIGTLRWQLHWIAWGNQVAPGGPFIKADDARLMFELTPEGSLAKSLTISFTRKGDAALVAGGYNLKGKGFFFLDADEFLNFDGTRWIAAKWPFHGSNIAIKQRFGSGSIRMDRIRTVLANVEPLNRRFAELLGDYKNLCTPVPVYESNDIII